MRLGTYQRMALQTMMVAFLIVPSVVKAVTETDNLSRGHTQFTSIVTKKAGVLVVTTPNGATHQLNENMARRHVRWRWRKPKRSATQRNVYVVLSLIVC